MFGFNSNSWLRVPQLNHRIHCQSSWRSVTWWDSGQAQEAFKKCQWFLGRFYLRRNSFSWKAFQNFHLSLSKFCLMFHFLLMNLQLNINIVKWGKSEYKWSCFIIWAQSGVLCVLSCCFQGGRGQTPTPQRIAAKLSGTDFEGSFPKFILHDRAVHKWQKS